MKELVVSQQIGVEPALAWALITDLEAWEGAISAIEKVERLDTADGFGVGTRWRETRTMFGRTATEEMEVTSIEDGQSYVVEAQSHGAHYRTLMAVEPKGEGQSCLSMTFGAEPTGLFAKIMGATVGRLFARATRKAIEGDLRDIAEKVEATQ